MSKKDIPMLRPYQVEHLAHFIKNPRFMDLSDPGTGKTPPACVYMNHIWIEYKERTVWLMPKSLLKKNKEELIRFTRFTEDEVVIVDGTKAKRDQLIASPNAKVLLMGFRSFTIHMKDIPKDYNFICVDEWHMGGYGPETQNTKNMYIAMRRFKKLLILTGTLVNGTLDSVFSAIQCIEPRYYGSFKAFRNLHVGFEDDYGRVLEWVKTDRVEKIIKKHSVRRTFEEVYGEKDHVMHIESIALDKKHYELYEEWHDAVLIELEDTWLEADNPGVATIRARQLLAHPETFGLLTKQVTQKDEALKVHLIDAKQNKQPLIIFSALHPEQYRIKDLCKKVGLTAEVINSDVSPTQRGQIDKKFRAGKLDVVVASPATASVGFNWQHVNHVIFASIDYMSSNFQQAIHRADRGSRTSALRITVLQYEQTIENNQFGTIMAKSQLSNTIDSSYKVISV